MSEPAISLEDAVSVIIDNRGRTCPIVPSGIPLIATNCIKNDRLYPVHENVRFVSPEVYNTWFRGHPQPGDYIFVTKGNPGRVCVVPEPVNFCIAQDMVALRVDPTKIYPKYLFAALRSDAVQAEIENMHVGTLIPHFKKGDFDKLLIPLLDPRVQKSLGDMYFDLSTQIDLNHRMNETLEAMLRTVFQDWFVDFGPTRAKVGGGQAPYLAPGLWVLFPDVLDGEGKPEGWKHGVLGDIAESITRTIDPSEVASETPYIGLEHMPRRSIALDSWESAGKVTSGKLSFRAGEFLFGKLRPYFHKVGIAPVDGISSTDIVVCRGTSTLTDAFALCVISSAEFVRYTDQASTGTKMPRTSWPIMRQYKITLPSSDGLMHAFEDFAAPLMKQIVKNVLESRTLSEIRDLLLLKVMNGEIQLRGTRE